VVVLVGAYGIPLLSLALLLVNGMSLHDRIAGTRVATEDPEGVAGADLVDAPATQNERDAHRNRRRG